MTDILKGWYSGQVVRKHAMMNIRAENNAEHSWGVVHILLSIWPKTSSRLIIACQYHDFGEKATGDVPGPVRWANPDLAAKLDGMEMEYMELHLPPEIVRIMVELTFLEKQMIEFCDRVEFCFSAIREINLGNQYMRVAFNRSHAKATEALERIRGLDESTYEPAFQFWKELNSLKHQVSRSDHNVIGE